MLLVPASGGSPPRQVVFVARHLDEYTGQWVVHQAGDRDAPQVAQALVAVGCDVAVR